MTSSTVGILWWSQWIALLRSHGSRYRWSSLFAFCMQVIDDTQSVGWSMWVITPRASIFARCSLTLGCNATRHFLGACMTRWASGHSCILYLPGNLPILVNLLGNSIIKSSVDLMHLDFNVLVAGGFVALAAWVGVVPVRLLLCWVVLTVQFTWTTANFSHAGRPRRAGPGVSVMYQYEWMMHGWAPGVLGCQRIGPPRIPYRGIGDPL